MNAGLQARPVAKRSIVVCPSSLTNNWAAEVRKWLGPERCQAMVVQSGAEAKNQASQWHCKAVCRCNPHHVLLTSSLLLLSTMTAKSLMSATPLLQVADFKHGSV